MYFVSKLLQIILPQKRLALGRIIAKTHGNNILFIFKLVSTNNQMKLCFSENGITDFKILAYSLTLLEIKALSILNNAIGFDFH